MKFLTTLAAVSESIPSSFLLNLFTTAALKATPSKSMFSEKSISCGINGFKFSKDALEINVSSPITQEYIGASNFVVYLYFIFKN